MQDMRHFISFMLPFLIHTFVTFHFMGLTTNIEFQNLMRSLLNIQNHFECESQPIKLNFSDCLQVCYVTCLAVTKMLDTFPRMNGILTGTCRLDYMCLLTLFTLLIVRNDRCMNVFKLLNNSWLRHSSRLVRPNYISYWTKINNANYTISFDAWAATPK